MPVGASRLSVLLVLLIVSPGWAAEDGSTAPSAHRAEASGTEEASRSEGPFGASLARLISALRKEQDLVGLGAIVMVDGQVVAARRRRRAQDRQWRVGRAWRSLAHRLGHQVGHGDDDCAIGRVRKDAMAGDCRQSLS